MEELTKDAIAVLIKLGYKPKQIVKAVGQLGVTVRMIKKVEKEVIELKIMKAIEEANFIF